MPDEPKAAAAQAKAAAAERQAAAASTAQGTATPQTVQGATPGTQQVVVEGKPLAAAVGAEPEPGTYSPYVPGSPSEIVAGGQYRRNTMMKNGKHFGGEVVNGKGEVLATFEDGQENNGDPETGTKPEPAPK
jgi:hypothetical protein